MAASQQPPATGDVDPEVVARALQEYMTVVETSPGIYEVSTQSGRAYQVDPRLGACTCPDARYRGRQCKHVVRVQLATGRRPLPEWVERDAVNPSFSEVFEL